MLPREQGDMVTIERYQGNKLLWAASHWLADMTMGIVTMGVLLSNRSYSGLLPWSGGVCWANRELGLALAYLRGLCSPTMGTRGHSSLRSMEQWSFVPFVHTSTRQTRAF